MTPQDALVALLNAHGLTEFPLSYDQARQACRILLEHAESVWPMNGRSDGGDVAWQAFVCGEFGITETTFPNVHVRVGGSDREPRPPSLQVPR